MCYCGGETAAAGVFPGSRNRGRWIQSSFLKSEQRRGFCLAWRLSFWTPAAPSWLAAAPSCGCGTTLPSVFSGFPRCLENVISSLGCHPAPRRAVQHPWTTLMHAPHFPISCGVTPFSVVLELQDSLLIIVFALSNQIQYAGVKPHSLGEREWVFFPIHTPKWLA